MDQAIKVRLVRCYGLHGGDDLNNVYSLECVFHDQYGSRIHASIKCALIPKFKDILREEYLFLVKNFVLTNNNMRVKTSPADWRIIFTPKTQVVEVFDANFPRNVFDFKSYDDLALWENVNEDLLIDIIGLLSSRSGRQTREILEKETTMVDITLKNLKGISIPCTLWGIYAEELLTYVNNNDGPVVVIMQMCKVRSFRGQIGLSNTFKISKVIFNGNMPEVEQFRIGLVEEGNLNVPVTAVPLPPIVTMRDDLQMNRDKILNVNQLIRVHEIDQFWVFCEVVGLEPMFDWFYISCKKCFKKMSPCGNNFYCTNCDVADTIGTLRYKVIVRVADNWGVASLILWDKECVDLIGHTAAELKAISNGKRIPKAKTRLVGLQGLFKVNLKEFSTGVNLGPFPVLKMTSDTSLINEFSNFANVSNVGVEDRYGFDEPDPVFAPIKPVRPKAVPVDVTVCVKRNLIGEFSGSGRGEGEGVVAKVPKVEGIQMLSKAAGKQAVE